jgi:3-ketoacyl-CoA synthase
VCWPSGVSTSTPAEAAEAAADVVYPARTQVCFTAVREVLSKSGVTPRQVGCVIVNCSLFNPTPSLSAVIMK